MFVLCFKLNICVLLVLLKKNAWIMQKQNDSCDGWIAQHFYIWMELVYNRRGIIAANWLCQWFYWADLLIDNMARVCDTSVVK